MSLVAYIQEYSNGFISFLNFDASVFAWIEAHLRGDFWDAFFSFITHLGDGGWFFIVLSVALVLIPKTRKIGTAMLIAIALNGILVNLILKNVFDRPRPYDLQLDWWAAQFNYPDLIKKPSSASFPSGHTSSSIAVSMAMLFGTAKWHNTKPMRFLTPAVVVIGFLVGFSRIQLGVHYASDVIGGFLAGLLCAVLAMLILRWAAPVYDKLNAGLEKLTDQLFKRKGSF
ncbi:MAG: phosphatase PAP2 family protein [Oscillospiraceae bacterium]|nr:phosphatase PAP2 family protein [Oscillospiraceae bacterium]